MRLLPSVFVAALLGACAALPTSPALAKEVLAGPVQAELVEVKDGDTVRVRASIWLGQEIEVNVRISGIDTPEKGGWAKCARERALAEKAKLYLSDFLGDGPLILSDIQYGKYAGRVMADVANGEFEDAATALMQEGLARAYQGKKRRGWCEGT